MHPNGGLFSISIQGLKLLPPVRPSLDPALGLGIKPGGYSYASRE